MSSQDNSCPVFRRWCSLAKLRATIMLKDGSTATLLSCNPYRNVFKIYRQNRHLHVSLESLHAVLVDSEWLFPLRYEPIPYHPNQPLPQTRLVEFQHSEFVKYPIHQGVMVRVPPDKLYLLPVELREYDSV